MTAACAAVERKAHLTIQPTLQRKEAVPVKRHSVYYIKAQNVEEKTHPVAQPVIEDPEAGESTGKEQGVKSYLRPS